MLIKVRGLTEPLERVTSKTVSYRYYSGCGPASNYLM